MLKVTEHSSRANLFRGENVTLSRARHYVNNRRNHGETNICPNPARTFTLSGHLPLGRLPSPKTKMVNGCGDLNYKDRLSLLELLFIEEQS